MTVTEFLDRTQIPAAEIAEKTGVHRSQVYRWKSGEVVPSGVALLKLVELSGGRIKADDVLEIRRRAAK